jgi:RHS repeat-associated protein
VRRFVYDTLSRLTSSSNPESNTATTGTPPTFVRVNTTYSYDPNGNLLQKTSPLPNQGNTATQAISYCYDALNRITGKKYAAQTCPLTSPVASYSYDQASFNGLTISNGIGRRTGMTDQAGFEAWSYDSMGRPASDKRTIGSVNKTISYLYNLLGSPTSITYPSGRTIAYTYDTAGHATSAADTPNSINYATLASYSPSGALNSLKNGTNLTSAFYYNNRFQPCRIFVTTGTTNPSNCADVGTIGNILDLTYGFNLGAGDSGNVISITNNRDSARNQTFAYDLLNRIGIVQTSATTGTKCFGESFGYDAWGNLLTIGGLSGYSGCTQENLGVGANVKNQIGTNAYDAAGNMTTGGYTYDAENHLLTAGGVTYTYDGDGKRVKKSSGKLYWYGMSADALDETDLTGVTNNSAFNEYIFVDGKRIARRDSSNTVFYYFADHLGTSRVMVQSGQASACYDADFYPFGGERSPITNSCPQNYKFTGKERDNESGLDDFGARYDSSSLGRFITPDDFSYDGDFGDPQKMHLYSYTRNNPLRLVDRDGHLYVVCFNGEEDCRILTDQQYKDATSGNNPGVEAPKFGQSGNITCGGEVCGHAYYFNDNTLINSNTLDPKLTFGWSDETLAVGRNLYVVGRFILGSDRLGVVGLAAPLEAPAQIEKAVEYVNLADKTATTHILDGDATGGGHLAGSGIPGKSEFPVGWSREKVMHEISDVATDPASKVTRVGQTTLVEGTREGVEIKVVIRDGRIVTGYPTNLPRNP